MKLKKIIFNVLCNPVFGYLIHKTFNGKIPNIRYKGLRYYVPDFVDNNIKASIFWGFYEAAELRLIQKYFTGNENIIEFGGSLGYCSKSIIKKLTHGKKLIIVEPNDLLINYIEQNVNQSNINNNEFRVLCNAINYEQDTVFLKVSGNNTASSIASNNNSNADYTEINSITLNNIVDTYLNNSKYSLICDIEGSEIQLLIEDKQTLKNCNSMIIELHNTEYKGKSYSNDDLEKIIVNDCGFSFIERDGFVYYFKRNSN